MLVHCPACQARYNVPEAALGTAGRQLKCAKCGHQWHVSAPAEATAADFTPSTVTPAPDPTQPEPAVTAETTPETVPAAAPPADDPIQNLARLASLRHAPGWLPPFLLPVFNRVQGQLQGLALLRTALIAVAVLLALIWFITLRHHHTQQNKITYSTSSSQAALPPPPAIPTQPTTLQLANLTLALNREAATPYRVAIGSIAPAPTSTTLTLTVSGVLTNTGSTAQVIPELRVQLLNHQNQELDNWPATLADTTLQPGQSTRWQARFPSPDVAHLASYRTFFAPANAAENTPPAVSLSTSATTP